MAITGEGQIVEAFVKKLLAERNLDVTAAVIEDQANIDLVVRVHKRLTCGLKADCRRGLSIRGPG